MEGGASTGTKLRPTSDPTLPGVFFFLGNSYDNLYKPTRAGEPQNDAYIQKAIENYRKAADTDPAPIMGTGDAVPGGRLRPGQAEQSG